MGIGTLKLSVGDLIKWYEEYSDGIVGDAGTGILIETRGSLSYGNSFKIYRNKFNDFVWVSQRCIESI